MSVKPDLEMLNERRTKIVATLGPASFDAATIEQLIKSGANMFRVNMSHGSHDVHAQTIEHVRNAALKANAHIPILADLAGPKIRIGTFENGAIELNEGEQVTITTRPVQGEANLIVSQYATLSADVAVGDRILLSDGLMELIVAAIDDTEVLCNIVQGGLLKDRQGMHLPNVAVSAPCLGEKDLADVEFLLSKNVDFLGLSFVRDAADVEQLRAIITKHDTHTGIIAKIERAQALENSEAIIAVADAIMVARGDLGVELPPEDVPIAQRQLVSEARSQAKAVIVATQMLESMIENPRPTRAEVADVSSTVLSGADAIMLSGETAVGAHPRRAVQMMDRIARRSEAYLWSDSKFASFGHRDLGNPPLAVGDAIARSTAQLSRDQRIRAVFVISSSGMSAATTSSAKPAAPIVSISRHDTTCRKMALMWGVVPYLVSEDDLEEPLVLIRRLAAELNLGDPGQLLLLVRGFAADRHLNTPSITTLSI